MKSIYLHKGFAKYRNDMAGPKGDCYKQLIIDPIIMDFLGNLKGKTILDLGCGNGYLVNALIKKGAEKVVGVDVSSHNIDYAKINCKNNDKIEFFVQDVSKKILLKDDCFDIVYSNMLLPHIKDIGTVFKEVNRVLKKGGIFVFSTIHPSRFLRDFAKMSSDKMEGIGNYFRRGRTKFEMGGNSEENTTGVEIDKKYKVENYQRTIEDYITNLLKNGFSLQLLREPNLSKKLLNTQPKFAEYQDHPISLIVASSKF